MKKTLAFLATMPGLFAAETAMAHSSAVPHTHVDGFVFSLLLPAVLSLSLIALSAMVFLRFKPRKAEVKNTERD